MSGASPYYTIHFVGCLTNNGSDDQSNYFSIPITFRFISKQITCVRWLPVYMHFLFPRCCLQKLVQWAKSRHARLYGYQYSLPSLPLPKLSETLERVCDRFSFISPPSFSDHVHLETRNIYLTTSPVKIWWPLDNVKISRFTHTGKTVEFPNFLLTSYCLSAAFLIYMVLVETIS